MLVNSSSRELKVALIGANGMLAQMVRERAPQGCSLHLFDLPEFDLADHDEVHEMLTKLVPDVIINCAAYTNVDGAETEQALAMEINGAAVGYLSKAALAVDATLVHISTDYVFDGKKVGAYSEADETCPVSVYGVSKLSGEQALVNTGLKKYFILRTSWLYGPGGSNFVETILRLAADRDELRIIHDQIGSPTYTGDLADAIFSLLSIEASPQSTAPDPHGVYHFANEGSCSWYEFACAIVEEGRSQKLPIKVREIYPINTSEYPLPATRPANSVFDKTKYKALTGQEVPLWRDSLHTYFCGREKSN